MNPFIATSLCLRCGNTGQDRVFTQPRPVTVVGLRDSNDRFRDKRSFRSCSLADRTLCRAVNGAVSDCAAARSARPFACSEAHNSYQAKPIAMSRFSLQLSAAARLKATSSIYAGIGCSCVDVPCSDVLRPGRVLTRAQSTMRGRIHAGSIRAPPQLVLHPHSPQPSTAVSHE